LDAQNHPIFKEKIDPKDIAKILCINEENIDTQYPIQIVSTGLPTVIAPIKTLIVLESYLINHNAYQQLIDKAGKVSLLIFTQETIKEENDLHLQVFVDDTGFFEDPATGSANGNLAAYLLKYNFFNGTNLDLKFEQGYAIYRPSLIRIKAEYFNENFSIRIGGKVFLVAKGEWM